MGCELNRCEMGGEEVMVVVRRGARGVGGAGSGGVSEH